MTFSEKLFMLRTENNITQSKLASEMNVSRQSVSKWELGEAVPEMKNIKKLSAIFGVNVEFLLNDNLDKCDLITKNEFSEPEKTNSDIHNFKNQIIISYVLISVGLIIIIALSVLSTICISYTEIEKESDTSQISFVDSSDSSDFQNETYTELIESRGLVSFLSTYHLSIVFIFAVFMVIFGLIKFIKALKIRGCSNS